jgi:hypothetical protein
VRAHFFRHLTVVCTAAGLALAGCGNNSGAGSDPGAAFAGRAAAVADAWQSTTTQTPAWQSQIIPVQALTVPPAKLSPDAQRAFDQGWYGSRISLSTQVPSPATVAIPGGGPVTASLVSAATAFADIDRGDAECQKQTAAPPGSDPSAPAGGPAVSGCVELTVTSVKLGSVQLRTNRGILDLPAWLFQASEASAPVARVAVTAATFGALPKSGATSWDNAPVSAATKLRRADQNTLEFIVAVEACAEDLSGLVHETDNAVVVGGWAKGKAKGPCTGSAALEPVTVTLTKPLAARVILDSVSGQPLL